MVYKTIDEIINIKMFITTGKVFKLCVACNN